MKPMIVIFFIAFVISGCAATGPQHMYWGKYSNTLYELKKSPGEKATRAHMEELREIIDKSKEKNLRVPPGVYAELGQFYQMRNESGKAVEYYRLEAETYPEAQQLMSRLISQSK